MTVTGVRNAAFPKPGQEWHGVIAPIRASQATCVFTGVPAGNYAIAFFHAEQNETQLTPGLFGKPTQGYGFSNNTAGSFGPPNFTAAAFAHDGHPAPSPTGAVFMLAVMSARRWRATTARLQRRRGDIRHGRHFVMGSGITPNFSKYSLAAIALL